MIYEASEWQHKQDHLHELHDPEMVAKGFRIMNRMLMRQKKPTYEILMPEPKVIKDLQVKKEVTGNCCSRCGSILGNDCKSGCSVCGLLSD